MSNLKKIRNRQWKIKQSISHSEENNYLYNKTYEEMWGKERAKEIKRKKSLALKEKPISKQARKNMSITRKYLIKIGKIKMPKVSLKGKDNPMYGIKRPDVVLRNKLIIRKKGYKRLEHSKFMKEWHKIHIHPNYGKPNYKLKLLNQNPEFIKKALKSKRIRPNKPEKVIISLIKQNNLPFRFVGNGSYMVGIKNPDFISNNKKQIIEIFGDYYHNENKRDIPFSRTYYGTKNYYENKGYSILILWEHELNEPEDVLNKIKEFTEHSI